MIMLSKCVHTMAPNSFKSELLDITTDQYYTMKDVMSRQRGNACLPKLVVEAKRKSCTG